MQVARPKTAFVASRELDDVAVYWSVLLELGFDVTLARDGYEAWKQLLRFGDVAILVTDIWLPRLDGISLVHRLREELQLSTRVVLFSRLEKLRQIGRQQATLLGVSAVVDHPVSRERALAVLTVEAGLRSRSRLSRSEEHASAAAASPQLSNEDRAKALRQLVITDSLTSLLNRRGADDAVAREVERAKREQVPLSLILLDVDRFKNINDRYGHSTGDRVLKHVSAILKRHVRGYDIVARWGGEEFSIVLTVDLDQARQIAERLRTKVQNASVAQGVEVTISGGIATSGPMYDFDAMFAAADRRLLQAKQSGRNCNVSDDRN